MKKIIIYSMFLFSFQIGMAQDAVFELDGQQSMCITGKGIGQDGAYNPYSDSKSIAVVKNLDRSTFSVRIQKSGKIIQDVAINGKEEKEFILEKGYVLYLDSENEGKAKVTFKEFTETEKE